MVLLLDGLSLLYRTLATPDGFASLVARLLREERPVGLAIAVDGPGPTVRHLSYPAYKAGRSPAPEALRAEVLRLPELGVPVHLVDNQEADDVLATLVTRIPHPTRIVTADSDLLQLVDDRVSVRFVHQKSRTHQLWDPGVFRARYGFAPALLPTWKAMVGDPSDNLPGVPGIGPRTATRLCAAHGDAAGILAALDSRRLRNPRVPPLLSASRDALVRWERLGRLDRTVPLTEPLWAPVFPR